jgi:hypothetical protein
MLCEAQAVQGIYRLWNSLCEDTTVLDTAWNGNVAEL